MKSSFVTSPISTTSNRPSSGSASGASFIPPPCQRPFATITSCMRPFRSPASEATVTSVFFQAMNSRVSA